MRTTLILSVAILALGGCAPLAQAPEGAAPDVATLSDVGLSGAGPDAAAQLAAAPDGADLSAPGGVGGRPAPEAGAPAQGGLLGFFRRQSDRATSSPPEDAAADRAGDRVLASLPAESRAADPAPAPGGGGFLSGLLGGGSGPATAARSEVGPNETVPLGQMARLCGVDVTRLGQEVEAHRRYRLYDSAAGTTAPRNWYVSGFDDGCARQFTAALALFGTIETHESLRYGAAAKDLPVTETDLAYKDVKSRVCRVGRDAPCGARADRLDRTSVFLTIYERFGDNARWVNAFLHDGAVAAVDIASN